MQAVWNFQVLKNHLHKELPAVKVMYNYISLFTSYAYKRKTYSNTNFIYVSNLSRNNLSWIHAQFSWVQFDQRQCWVSILHCILLKATCFLLFMLQGKAALTQRFTNCPGLCVADQLLSEGISETSSTASWVEVEMQAKCVWVKTKESASLP